jgi:hypothetical protein
MFHAPPSMPPWTRLDGAAGRRMRVGVRVRTRACGRACGRACVRACVRVNLAHKVLQQARVLSSRASAWSMRDHARPIPAGVWLPIPALPPVAPPHPASIRRAARCARTRRVDGEEEQHSGHQEERQPPPLRGHRATYAGGWPVPCRSPRGGGGKGRGSVTVWAACSRR